MGASKYKQDTIEIILRTIAETGSESSAWRAGEISEKTYRNWLERYEEFADRVVLARSEFLERNFGIFRAMALTSLYETLKNGVKRKRIAIEKERIKNKQTNRFELTVVSEKITVTEMGVPQWAIERALGRTTDEMDAVNALIEAGWFDPSLVAEISPEIEELNGRVRRILTRNAIV